MANPGVGTKFVSVNLNKSYGQQPHHQNPLHGGSGTGSNRIRTSHGGGGGGMVVLSRSRSSQKVGPKLSVPPPLNLPSLRKEHERFDSSGFGGGTGGGGSSGSGSRPSSSGMGWTKPGTLALQEKDGGRLGAENEGVIDGVDPHSDSVSRGSSVYTPPSLRSSSAVGVKVSAPAPVPMPVEKAVVLKGEDFPSLRAALPAMSGPAQKLKDGSLQKQKHTVDDQLSDVQRERSKSGLHLDMRPNANSSHRPASSGTSENAGEGYGLGSSLQSRKQEEYFPGPLPLVRLNPRLDWADDERDTGNGLASRERDHGFSKSEAYWEKDFDLPRGGFLPHKPLQKPFDRWAQRDDEAGKVSSSEVSRVEPYGKDIRTPSREGREANSWRASSLQKEVPKAQELASDRNGLGTRPSIMNTEQSKENRQSQLSFGETIRYNAGLTGNKDPTSGRRDLGYGQGVRQPWNKTMESLSSRGAERNGRNRYGNDQPNRYRGDTFLNNLVSKSSFSAGSKGLPVNDPILNFGRGKHSSSKSEKPYTEDPFLKDFGDGGDPFSMGLVGVVKRKKDVQKQTDFHDPVRESFEAELERVQKMQEQERQRIIEEQERALELARKEEEEREQLAREQEEQRRRLEEEAREAAWRAEQEQMEAMRRAEEQKIAREEEKRRILMEEERRKQAAKQKLLELEAKMAKRHAEAAKGDGLFASIMDEKASGFIMERDMPKATDLGDWEDGERMVQRITTSESSDLGLNRHTETGSRPHLLTNGSSQFLDRGRPVNSWRRDVFDNGNGSTFFLQDRDNSHHSPRRDASGGGRAFPREDYYGGAGFVSSRNSFRGGLPEPLMDEFNQFKGQRWAFAGDGEQYGRNTEPESEFQDNFAERYGDMGWGQGRSRGYAQPPFAERMYQNSEGDGVYSFGKSRYSMRQPRVLPPPSVSSIYRVSYRGGQNDHPGPSSFLESDMHYNGAGDIHFSHAARSEPPTQTGYDASNQENFDPSELTDIQQDNAETERELSGDAAPRCDSQSSLSVSSPPSSPTHLSHDDLDESGDSPVLLPPAEGKDAPLSGNGPVLVLTNAEKENIMRTSSSISIGDDEEWTIENNEELQEQEDYDENEDGYHEEDEVHGVDDENVDLAREFEVMHLEEKGSPRMEKLDLGLNESVEMPGEDPKRISRNEEGIFGVPQVSACLVEDTVSFDGMCDAEPVLQPVNDSADASIDGFSRKFQDSEMTIQDLAAQQNVASHTSGTSDLLEPLDSSSGLEVSVQHVVPSSVNMPLHSAPRQNVVPSVPTAPSQAELPVKLQFGLFSGPALIPSPVPAIQIGSIQMPLHLHPPVGGPSLTHMHPSQPPIFQFGQLRYTSPISQGILPLAHQPVSFVQPNLPTNYPLNQNSGGPLPTQSGQDTFAHNVMKDEVQSSSRNNQSSLLSRQLDPSQEKALKDVNYLPVRESVENNVLMCQSQQEFSHTVQNKIISGSVSQAEEQEPKSVENNLTPLDGRQSESLVENGATSQSHPSSRGFNGPQFQGPVMSSKGKKFISTVKNPGTRSSLAVTEASQSDSTEFQRHPRRNFQRVEFRVRENTDKRQNSGLGSSNHSGPESRSNFNGRNAGMVMRSGSRRSALPDKPLKQMPESEFMNSDPVTSQEINSESRTEKGSGKDASAKGQNRLHSGDGHLKRSISSEEDVDAPLQSGIVRVFKQPGIETPSDEDDFIEVRSKRQMLNDRREQREKEIKAKSRVTKTIRKPRPTSQSTIISTNSNKNSMSLGGEVGKSTHTDFLVTEGHGLGKVDVSSGKSPSTVSQPLAPIGTPAVNTDAQNDTRAHNMKSFQTSSISAVSSGENLGSGIIFEMKNKALDGASTLLGSWGNTGINQQVMALTQTQLDEAMKPGPFETCVGSIGDHASSICGPSMSSSSILTKEKSFSSATSPINSLLAGEKIQFGAVTSPTILPPSSHAVSHSLSATEDDCSLFFENGKHPNESCVPLEDCEAEAEAAASAVAVAAIGSDEIIGNELGTSASDDKSFEGADIEGITTGVTGDKQSAIQSRNDESLSVSLPADLSVETPSISLWQPLLSPQNSSSQMISHFPGGAPSHFPFYEMNRMLGGPILAFGPHDESAGSQSQSQKSNPSGSGPVGDWQHPSGIDSFYGPPAGFTGPFISPAGGITGVQGPPHMVVYNHFAPVGQFGQVGLSFMGTTYIPSGKQPDWKHDPTSSAMGTGEGDMNNLSMVSAPRNLSNVPSPIRHLAPGSPLLPMASPMAMFDVSPFQSSLDMSVQTRWSQVPNAPLHTGSLSMPLQQQPGVLPQFSHGLPVEQSISNGRLRESRTSTPSNGGRNFSLATDAAVTRLPEELGLVESSNYTSREATTQNALPQNSSRNSIADVGKNEAAHNSKSGHSNGQNTSSAFKVQTSPKNSTSQQYGHPSAYNYQRGVSQKNSSGGEWPHHKTGFQHRNQSLGAERSYPSSKMKQIYVAKQQPASGTSTAE
ncbi:hypothetical protein RJ641_010266 [Dillenia turbinata]|uniref:Uncharacterized protein n=1 Tax=Dillenia turbinata TaxID=194707 RepID=A0AAN8V5R7_9MAGN